MSYRREFEFEFDEQHEEPTNDATRICPDCEAPVQASQLQTVCIDCGRVVASERGE